MASMEERKISAVAHALVSQGLMSPDGCTAGNIIDMSMFKVYRDRAAESGSFIYYPIIDRAVLRDSFICLPYRCLAFFHCPASASAPSVKAYTARLILFQDRCTSLMNSFADERVEILHAFACKTNPLLPILETVR